MEVFVLVKRLTKMEKLEIEKKANELLTKFDYDNENDDYVDAVKLAKFLGFSVGESSVIRSDIDGFIFMSPDETIKVIAVNNNRSPEEKRFIVLHEIAHYILHREKLKTDLMIREHRTGKNLDENDADFFAACVLMPHNSFFRFLSSFRKQNIDEDKIAFRLQEIFKTPLESVKRRIEEIDKV